MNAGLFGQLAAREPRLFQGGAQPFKSVTNHARGDSISEYALQRQKHTVIGRLPARPRRMERTPDERREILRKFIAERGLKKAAWAKAAGVDKNAVYNFLNGYSQSLDPRTYAKLARAAEVQVWQLTGDAPEPTSPTVVWVSGSVEAGAFREAIEWDRSLWFPVDVPVPARFQGKAKALQVRGNSMNVDYPDGSIAIWVDCLDFRLPRHGDDVLVVSKARDDGWESTLKELRIDDQGRRWLWPRSHDPLHQQPIDVANPPDHVAEIEIRGIVIGCYRPRVY
ncbi:hypothetical protein Pan3_49 [Pseudanabaena phage Pan3]|nr:hypothetical protein Pan3_49 [Pseudanabaena phage Pan3]